MSEGFLDFDINDVPDPNAVAPNGSYRLKITKFEQKTSKSGREMIECNAQIVGHEEHTGKSIFEYYVIDGNDYAGKNGRFQVAQIANAIGAERGTSWDDFIDKEFEAEISVEPPTAEFDRETNKIARIYI